MQASFSNETPVSHRRWVREVDTQTDHSVIALLRSSGVSHSPSLIYPHKEAGDGVKWLKWSGLLFLCALSWVQTPISNLSSAALIAQQKFCDESFNLISLAQNNQFDRIQHAVLSWKHGNKNNLYCNHFLSQQWQNNTALMAPGTKTAVTGKTSWQDKVLFLYQPPEWN